MKFVLASTLTFTAVHAFAPLAPRCGKPFVVPTKTVLADDKGGMFFASSDETQTPEATKTTKVDQSLEEEVEEMVQKALKKNKIISNLRSERGNEYAPWMGITENDENEIRKIMRDKAEVRRRRRDEELTVRGALLKDSTVQELSGTGLKSKVVDGTSVELEWSTGAETSTKGFIIKRRAAKQPDFEVLASYETYGPLVSKGVEGGDYRYLDENVGYGSWFYRITECEESGLENDMSQCLVDVETDEEQRGAVLAAGAMALAAVAAVVAGSLLDPVQY